MRLWVAVVWSGATPPTNCKENPNSLKDIECRARERFRMQIKSHVFNGVDCDGDDWYDELNLFGIAAAALAAVVAAELAAFAHSMGSHCDFHDATDAHRHRPIAVNYTRLANTDCLVDRANSVENKIFDLVTLDSVTLQINGCQTHLKNVLIQILEFLHDALLLGQCILLIFDQFVFALAHFFNFVGQR